MDDSKIAEALGMSLQNLTRTYKNSRDDKKRLMYEVIKIGFEVKEKNINLLEFDSFANMRDLIISLEKNKVQK